MSLDSLSKRTIPGLLLGCFLLLSSSHGAAQDETPADDSREEAVGKENDKDREKASKGGPTVNHAAALDVWQKTSGDAVQVLPRTWLFLQEEGGAYGAPSLLALERGPFENYGWIRLAEPEAIRLFIQMNPTQKKTLVRPEELSSRLKLYAELSRADGVILKSAASPPVWAIYAANKGFAQPLHTFDKSPESLRQDLPVRWLVQQLGYDALVVGNSGELLVLAKLKPLKSGAQGFVLQKSGQGIVADGEKDIGALVRVVYENERFALAKVALSTSARVQIPRGSKVLFDQP